ncbi:DUF433 domain-containing protein [Cyclobacterium sp.]|uniref:DUF433 domain-containing protein n=1 Tax=Cyclobacterium sp. TaxID=1966343 RepID=UPI0025C4AAB5|nr:DUF433 domain-containing protein [Cyclobacterium sp.]
MRIRVIDILDLLAAGLNQEQILTELPDLVNEDIEASIKYARGKINHSVFAAFNQLLRSASIFPKP